MSDQKISERTPSTFSVRRRDAAVGVKHSRIA